MHFILPLLKMLVLATSRVRQTPCHLSLDNAFSSLQRSMTDVMAWPRLNNVSNDNGCLASVSSERHKQKVTCRQTCSQPLKDTNKTGAWYPWQFTSPSISTSSCAEVMYSIFFCTYTVKDPSQIQCKFTFYRKILFEMHPECPPLLCCRSVNVKHRARNNYNCKKCNWPFPVWTTMQAWCKTECC